MRTIPPELLETITKRLVNRFHPEKIILFGSHAWGDPNEDSDIDLMLIVPDSDIRPIKRSVLAHRCLRGLNVPKDIIVKTRAEVEKYRNIHASLECEALERGKVLYECGQKGACAKLAAEGDDPYLDTAIYHCQQAAEKAIKGFLVFHDHRFEKTHDLEMLMSLAKTYESGFESLIPLGEDLTPYATIYRYPGDFAEPESVKFEDALKASEKNCDFVHTIRPQDVHP